MVEDGPKTRSILIANQQLLGSILRRGRSSLDYEKKRLPNSVNKFRHRPAIARRITKICKPNQGNFYPSTSHRMSRGYNPIRGNCGTQLAYRHLQQIL